MLNATFTRLIMAFRCRKGHVGRLRLYHIRAVDETRCLDGQDIGTFGEVFDGNVAHSYMVLLLSLP